MPKVIDDEDTRLIAELSNAMLSIPAHDAAAAAFSFLLYLSETNPLVLRRLLNEPVVKEGFRGVPMITILDRIARTS